MMDSSTKILIGAAATVVLGAFAHMAIGADFIDGLSDDATQQLSDNKLGHIKANFVREPSLKRIAILSGEASGEEREKALSMVGDIPGVAGAVWEEDAATEENETNAPAAASAEDVAKCQGDIDTVVAGKNINFKSGSAYVPPASLPLIDELVAIVKPCSGINLEVQGHTDLIGNADGNARISQARADAVMKVMVEKGIDAALLSAKGYGASQPIENARTYAANAKNRRTVFIVSSLKN